MTSEPTPDDDVAARFKSNEPEPDDYVRLDGEELKALLIGAEVRHPRGMPHARQEFFDTNGIRRVFSGYKWLRHRYVIVGDALCVERPSGWRCRRFYRHREGVVFQVREEASNQLEPVEIRRVARTL